MKDIYKDIASKRLDLQASPLSVIHKGKLYKVYVHLKMSMIDGKMRTLVSGLGGAFCILCTCSREEAVSLVHSFTINRTGAQITEIWNKLSSGELVKKPHDRHIRLGVTREPIIDLETIASVSPLHSLMRAFDFFLKIIYHLNAGLFIWSNGKSFLGSDYVLLQQSKDRVRASIKEKTNISVDIPDFTGKGGMSTTGNVVHSLMSEEKKSSYH